MTKFVFTILLTAFASSGVLAQGPAEPVGIVQSAEGLVTVSQGNSLGNVVKNEKILNGARVVTTSTGTAVVKLNNGCLVTLSPNQAVTIDSKLDCKAMVASVQSTGAGTVLAGADTAGAGGYSGVAAAIVGGIGVALIVNSNSDNSSTPQPSSGS